MNPAQRDRAGAGAPNAQPQSGPFVVRKNPPIGSPEETTNASPLPRAAWIRLSPPAIPVPSR